MAAVWDDARVFEADQALGRQEVENKRQEYQRRFQRFILEFTHDHVFPYRHGGFSLSKTDFLTRMQLRQNLEIGNFNLEVDLEVHRITGLSR